MNVVKTIDGKNLILNTDSVDTGERDGRQKRISELIISGLSNKKKNAD